MREQQQRSTALILGAKGNRAENNLKGRRMFGIEKCLLPRVREVTTDSAVGDGEMGGLARPRG